MPKTIDRSNLGELLESGSFTLAELGVAMINATAKGLSPTATIVLERRPRTINFEIKKDPPHHSPETSCQMMGCCREFLASYLGGTPNLEGCSGCEEHF